MGQRARNAGFDFSDNINNLANFSDFERLFHPTLLADRTYIKLNIMCFVATVLGVNIVVWVPGPGGDIIVHRQHQMSVGRSVFYVHQKYLNLCIRVNARVVVVGDTAEVVSSFATTSSTEFNST